MEPYEAVIGAVLLSSMFIQKGCVREYPCFSDRSDAEMGSGVRREHLCLIVLPFSEP